MNAVTEGRTDPSPNPAELPDGPFGLRLLEAIRADPLGAGSALRRRYGDVASIDILFRRIVYLFNPDMVRQMLVDHADDFEREARLLRIFESFQGRNVLTTEGPAWERQRRLLTPAFAPRRMAGYMGLMRDAIAACIAEELPGPAQAEALVDVDFLTTRITMDVILRTLFSHAATRDEALEVSGAIRALTRQSMREVYWPLIPPSWLPYPGRREKQAHQRILQALIARHIDARRARGTSEGAAVDVLDMLLAAREDAPTQGAATLTEQEIHDNCFVLFAAGFDTASSGLSWWIGLMATQPEVASRVRAEVAQARSEGASLETIARLPLLNATLEEAMRLYPPSTALFTRVARRDVVIGTTPIAKGTLVAVPIWHLHRDPRAFPEPLSFRPQRFLPGAPSIPRGAYLPFGAGPHFCLGQHFATVEMALVAAHLIEGFELEMEPGATLPEPIVDLALKPKGGLRVRFKARPEASTAHEFSAA